jgi:hypothetical protein
VVQHDDAVGDAHDHPDVVLHEQDGEPPVAEIPDERHQRVCLPGAHAGRRLVEEEDARLDREGAGQLEPLLVAVGEIPGELVAPVPEAHAVEERRDPRVRLAALAAERGRPEKRADEASPGAPVPRDPDVLAHGEVAEEADVLECPGDAEAGARVGRERGDRAPAETHLAGRRPVEPRDDVEDGGLASAVRADDREDLAGAHRQRDARDGADAAEPDGEVLDLEEALTHRAACGRRVRPRENPPRSPCGRKRISPSRIAP